MILKTRSHLVLLLTVALLVSACGLAWATSGGGADSASYRVGGILVDQTTDEILLTVQGDSPPTYTMYELFEPLRIVLDIADANIDASVQLPLVVANGPVGEVRAETLDDQEPVVTRLEIILRSDNSYSVERHSNDIVVRFAADAANEEVDAMEEAGLVASLIENEIEEGDDTSFSELRGSSKDPVSKKDTPKGRDEFAFSGYIQDRITVDFFKIDLHNVFRLIGEVSGLNIVVDEEVKGSLTLALEDVPWDFALDVVLNLKDLQKMERFNTIMILPKAKTIDWPERAVDRLAFKADLPIVVEEQEAISVKERLSIPKEEMEAKKLIRLANKKIGVKDYPEALALYEKAFQLWPQSLELANQITSLCLVQLGLNAKAVHYAKQALRIDPQEAGAALQAAIGLANMQKKDEALIYFSRATQGERSPASALLSFSAFQEQQGNHSASLALLETFARDHGDTVDSMVSKARLYDKIGKADKAVEQYRSILLSGYTVPPDLKRYITARVAR